MPGLTLADLEASPAPEGLSHNEVTPLEREIAAGGEQPPQQREQIPAAPAQQQEPEQPEGGDKPEADDEPANISEAMDRAAKKSKQADDERKAKEAKDAEEKSAAETASKPAEEAPKPERDADLNKINLNSSAHETTRKNFNAVKKLAAAARDERDQAAAKATAAEQRIAEFEKRVAELEQASKSAKLPEATEKELATLRERVRELDISKDPALEAKYDRKIDGNNKAIIDVLKSQGFGTRQEDGKTIEDPKAVANLMRQGLTLSTLNPLLKKLDEAGLSDEAETIREAVRSNIRLAREKGEEIETWKGSYDQRKQAQQEEARVAQENHQKAVFTHRDTTLKQDMAALEKDLPFLKEPPQPAPTDTPTVQKAKQAARDAWNGAQAKVKEALGAMKTEGLPPEKLAEVGGKISAQAVQAVILKHHAIPNLLAQLKAAHARVKELEGQTQAQRAAGNLSRLQAGAGPSDPNMGKPEPKSLEEALDMRAREGGVI